MSNPLLSFTGLPPFSEIKPEHVEPAIDHLLQHNRKLVKQLVDMKDKPGMDKLGWDNFVQVLEDADDQLNRIWSPVSHMNSVVNSDELRDAYNACLPKLSEYGTEMGQNEDLFKAFDSINQRYSTTTFSTYNKIRRKCFRRYPGLEQTRHG